MRASRKNSPSKSGLLTPSVFDASALPERERFQAINDTYFPETLVLAPTRTVGHSIKTSATNWRLTDVSISRAFGHAHIGKVNRKVSAKYLYVRKYYSETFKVWKDGLFVHPQPGDIIVDTSSDKLIFSVEDLQSCYINIPLDYLPIDISPFQAPMILPANSLACRLLSSAIEIWLTELPKVRLNERKLFEATIVDLVSSVLQNRPQEEDGQALTDARNRAIFQYVEDHLDESDLSAGKIASAFRLSRASVYRRFESAGGVDAFIRTKRLEKALALLTSEPAMRGRVQGVAARMFFADPYHFSRAFKKELGFSPSEALSLAPAALPNLKRA